MPDRSPQPSVSGSYGFELDLPPDWRAHPATATWVSGRIEGRCPPAWDCFSDARDALTLAVAAMDVGEVTLGAWQERVDRSRPAICSNTAPPTETTLDGEHALRWPVDCPSEGLRAVDLVAVHRGRGYVLILASPSSVGDEEIRELLDSLLATFHFAPQHR